MHDFVGTSDFPRILQFTGYTCGACSIAAVLEFTGIRVPYSAIKKELTVPREEPWRYYARFLRKHGVRSRCYYSASFAQLRSTLRRGGVAAVSLDEWHVGVVHAMDRSRVWLADPLITRQLWRTTSRDCFMSRWTRTVVTAE